MNTTVLITGGAGFIGSNLLEYLFEKYPSYHFLVLDALTYAGNPKNFSEYIKSSPRFQFWYGDVTNPNVVNVLVSQSDLIVHLAAETHVARSIFDNSKFFHTDVIGTQTIMNAVLKSTRVKRCIHISSSEVYGTSCQNLMDEDHPLDPRSPYAGAKVGADRLVSSYWHTYDMPTLILRPFNNYGPRQHLEKVVPRFITSALKSESLTIHGKGEASRDWVHVTDTCLAIDLALHVEPFSSLKNQVINVGTGVECTIEDLANIILQQLKRESNLKTYLGDRVGQVDRHKASWKKAHDLLGWTPTVKFNDGLDQTIEWYKRNEPWWKELEWMKSVPIKTRDGTEQMH